MNVSFVCRDTYLFRTLYLSANVNQEFQANLADMDFGMAVCCGIVIRAVSEDVDMLKYRERQC